MQEKERWIQLIILYRKHIQGIITKNKIFTITLDMNQRDYGRLIKELQYIKLPELGSVRLNNVSCFKHPSIINKFLKESVARGTKQFTFCSRYDIGIHKSKAYIEGIQRVAEKVTNSLYLKSLWMGQKEFYKIMVSSQHIKSLEFSNCDITTDEECDFKGQLSDSRVGTIRFDYTGNKSQWNLNEAQRFKNIIKGLSKEKGIKANLEKISLVHCQIPKAEAYQILCENGLDKVNLSGC